MTPTTPTRIFVVDDDAAVRRSLARLLARAGYAVTVFSSAREFLARPRADAPACLVLDVRMPGLSGLDLQRALATDGQQQLSTVFITGYGDVAVGVDAMKGGAVDFLIKPVDKAALIGAVERALARTREALRDTATMTDIQARMRALTPREAEVFALVVTGMLNKQIAFDLGVGEKMVKVHRARVMEKMRAGSLAELVRLADRGGVFAPKR